MNRRTFLQGALSSSAVLAGTGEMDAASKAPVTEGSTAPQFDVRCLEIHSDQMWQWQSVARAFQMMERLKLNTLIFHQRDMTDYLVLPRAYFSNTRDIQRYAPVRKSTVYDYRDALRRVTHEARRRNMRLLIEVNEIYYPHGIVELNPELSVKGVVCPTNPFWWEFERKKYEEILEEIPDIGGVIVSPGTAESKLSIAANACTCDRCRSYDPALWYRNLTQSIYEPLHAKGKLLAIRDFSYTRGNQNVLVEACTSVGSDIILSLKNTPQDFYPTFPNNPLIGHSGGRTEWVEFDVWGQFFGHGFFPCSLVEDIQSRLIHCRKNGVKGVMFRIDWECTTDTDVFNGFNLLNLMAGGLLAQDPERDLNGVYRSWLDYGLLDPLLPTSAEVPAVPVSPADRGPIQDFMKASWKVMEKTSFVRGLDFTVISSMFPDSLNSTMVAGSEHIDAWIPDASIRVAPTEENISAIMAEKNGALREVDQLSNILRLSELQIPAGLKSSLDTMLKLYRQYVLGFKYCAAAYFRAKKAINSRRADDVQAARKAADEVTAYRQQTAQMLLNTSFPHYVYLFFALENLDLLTADIRNRLNVIHPS